MTVSLSERLPEDIRAVPGVRKVSIELPYGQLGFDPMTRWSRMCGSG